MQWAAVKGEKMVVTLVPKMVDLMVVLSAVESVEKLDSRLVEMMAASLDLEMVVMLVEQKAGNMVGMRADPLVVALVDALVDH